MKPSSSSPALPAAKRIQTIDILRGLALKNCISTQSANYIQSLKTS
jgi:hypothetical protein